MKFSYAMLPDYPLSESLASIKKADELGFYAVYAADETWHKDLWLLFAAAAADTTNIRMGPSVSGVVPPRADPDRAGGGDARRADRRAGRGRGLQRQLRPARAVPHRLGQDEASLPGQGGACRRSAPCSTTA